ncbi:hypothetical protein [Actinomycetospora atypica]|uniref:Uncharacterized protein n=1 Tax=Actinomycetospora atypica TaxID=1290095 RepID=A0ABV9YPD5_9PSEU
MPDGMIDVPPAPRGRRLAQQVHIGSVWVSLMEPEHGHEAAFNQWYGDDHFYAGGMNLPGIFAGRRWLCPVEHQALRTVPDGSLVDPPHAGRFLHLNFFLRGQVEDSAGVLGETIARLAGEGRMYVDTIPRRHVFSRLQPYVGAVYADPDDPGPLDIHALDHPFAGVVVQILQTLPGQSREALVEELVHRFVPDRIATAGGDMPGLPRRRPARLGRREDVAGAERVRGRGGPAGDAPLVRRGRPAGRLRGALRRPRGRDRRHGPRAPGVRRAVRPDGAGHEPARRPTLTRPGRSGAVGTSPA